MKYSKIFKYVTAFLLTSIMLLSGVGVRAEDTGEASKSSQDFRRVTLLAAVVMESCWLR